MSCRINKQVRPIEILCSRHTFLLLTSKEWWRYCFHRCVSDHTWGGGWKPIPVPKCFHWSFPGWIPYPIIDLVPLVTLVSSPRWGIPQSQVGGTGVPESQAGGVGTLIPGDEGVTLVPGRGGSPVRTGLGTSRDWTPERVLDIQCSVFLLHSRRRTVLFAYKVSCGPLQWNFNIKLLLSTLKVPLLIGHYFNEWLIHWHSI